MVQVISRQKCNLSLLVVGILLFTFSCSSSIKSQLPTTLPSTSQVTEQLSGIIADAKIPGISVSVISKGQQQNYLAGLADVEDSIVLTQKHRMPLGSIGKTFVAAGILQLIDEEKIALGDKAIDFLGKESWFGALPNAQEVTIKQLLNHTCATT